MGIPAFFRWLSKKYPKIVSQVVEERPKQINEITIPVDTSKRNPNGIEFDHLYLVNQVLKSGYEWDYSSLLSS